MSGPDDRPAGLFTLPQRRAILFLCTLLIAIVAIGLLRNRSFIDDPIPVDAERYLELQDRIDPNDADVAALAALPALGAKRAQDIVEFRDLRRAGDPHRIVFRTAEDLMQVRGIGAAITQQLKPYLRFPPANSPPTTTRPAAPSDVD